MLEQSGSSRQIILDLSRLLSRVNHPTPTGVDRVEMAYARALLKAVPHRLHFAAVHPFGYYGRLPNLAVERFIDRTEDRWAHQRETSKWEARRFAVDSLLAMRPRGRVAVSQGERSVYLKASPNTLARPDIIRSIVARERTRLVCLVHDLIPIEFPEYARPNGAAQHKIRVKTIMDHADGNIANSHATLNSLRPWLDRSQRAPAAAVAHLGTHFHVPPPVEQSQSGRPYFVCIGTIEPRKNHLLLLNIWRRMAEGRDSADMPKLVLIGRRGWENEQVVDMLERCPALKGCVEEQGRLTDREMGLLLGGAWGLLMPSFAEGYGMPVAEALALGVPVLCSDLPALREAGGGVPEYLDPLDGPAWRHAIDELSTSGSQQRRRQRERLVDWHAPTWDEHIAIVLEMLHKLPA